MTTEIINKTFTPDPRNSVAEGPKTTNIIIPLSASKYRTKKDDMLTHSKQIRTIVILIVML